jgi:hypothetical protein
MKTRTVFLYPGYITKGLKGRMFWHPKMPEHDMELNDWKTDKAVEISSCIHDPWPFIEGGKDCLMEIGTQQ